jgi:hypothetical protein
MNDDENSPFSVKLWQSSIAAELQRQQKWLNHPAIKSYREQRDREWKAKPWWERARIRSVSWLQQKRVRAGEVIAGRSFDD